MYTKEQVNVDEVRRMVNEGYNTNEIRKKLHTSYRRLREVCDKHGIKIPAAKRGRPSILFPK